MLRLLRGHSEELRDFLSDMHLSSDIRIGLSPRKKIYETIKKTLPFQTHVVVKSS